jgi:hypothetical protein
MFLQAATAVAQDYLNSPSVLADQITAAGLNAWLIQRLKNWPQLTWVSENSTKINRLISVGLALATTVGIHWAWKGSISAGGIFTLNLPPNFPQVIMSLLWRTGGSFVMQELVYQGVIKHEAGKVAADVVAGAVVEHKDELAGVVVDEGLKHDPGSLLKLADHPKPKEEAPAPKPPADDQPIDWNWGDKK